MGNLGKLGGVSRELWVCTGFRGWVAPMDAVRVTWLLFWVIVGYLRRTSRYFKEIVGACTGFRGWVGPVDAGGVTCVWRRRGCWTPTCQWLATYPT